MYFTQRQISLPTVTFKQKKGGITPPRLIT